MIKERGVEKILEQLSEARKDTGKETPQKSGILKLKKQNLKNKDHESGTTEKDLSPDIDLFLSPLETFPYKRIKA